MMKDDGNENTISLDIEYVQLMTGEIDEVAHASFKTIEERQ